MSVEAARWVDVEPLPEVNGALDSVLAPVHSLQRAWQAVVSANTDAFHEARRRSLRRHAIETGIIERLYDVDWGVTHALVAEGLTADAVNRSVDGSISEDVLRLIRTQYEALEFLADVARQGRELSTSLIRELHVALTRNQSTFTAMSPAGMVFEATLHHGEWKRQANWVERSDGSVLDYTPPEQVQPQIERLVEFYHRYRHVDPVVREAWLHHRFVRIHPFEDGNGRVARCLTLLGLLRHDFAPMVIDRRERDRYLRVLDRANDGDLRPLVRFFAELEIVALRSELEQPVAAELADAGRGAIGVLDAGIERLRGLRGTAGAAERAAAVQRLGSSVQDQVVTWLSEMAGRIENRLREGIDPAARTSVLSAAPPEEEARYWRRQVVQAANSVDFYANLQEGVWWTRLQVDVLGQTLRYLTFLQKVGRGETGVLTLTAYAEILGARNDDSRGEPELAVVSTPTETVTWVHTDPPSAQWDNVEHVLDATLAQALSRFTASLG
ncbi:Fic family protein [Natronosporangium hydrolyticum]|uniref:Fic family protein n=1 Tax=Natronosporangium hydrolyticum TaxID=2811111 RepID=A0A895YKE2_9ACTN|nr:Fic family protein [Natronosporangium hydrolyticum]QSB16502.1 Fic family protein [Natronosporangium hydrolyticum]